MEFPEFPPVTDASYDEKSGKVMVDFEWYLDLARFKEDYEALVEYYKGIEEIK